MKNLILFITLIVSLNAAAKLDPTVGRIETIYGGTEVIIGNPEASTSVTKNSPLIFNLDKLVLNRISLGVNLDYEEYFGSAFTTKVELLVERTGANGVAIADTTIFLEVTHDPYSGENYINKETAQFYNAYSINVEIQNIWIDGVLEDILPHNLYIEAEILLDRYTEFSESNTIGVTYIEPVYVDCDENNSIDAFQINWNSVMGAEEYQLEWLYINDYDVVAGAEKNPSTLEFNFKYNSTRISTTENSYTISNVFDKGWIVCRVRAIGVNLPNILQPIFGNWSLSESGNVGALSNSTKIQILENQSHERTLNWQYSATYAEEGKKKEIVSYFDGSLRNRQTVTYINSDDNIIVGETIYDHQGRPAINVLPTPVYAEECTEDGQFNSIHFYPNLNKNEEADNYSRLDFDIDNETDNCDVGASPMDTISGASRYYSPANTFQNQEQGYVPDAKKYPFTQVEYTPDNTGRIRRQGGVGEEFQLGNGHETKYLYGQPNQLELDRLFGSEVGYTDHYKKNVVIDAHGQASISYLDQEGRVIATALAGDAPELYLKGIKSESEDPVELTVNAFGANNGQNQVSVEGNSVEFSTQLLVAYESNYTFNYGIQIDPIQDECLTDICIDCVYDLKLELVDECGVNLAPTSLENAIIGNFQGNEEAGYTFHQICSDASNIDLNESFSINLVPGSYSLNKILTINEDARQAFIDLYFNDTLNDCVMTFDDFLEEEMSNIDTTLCAPTCETCLEDLGTLEDYLAQDLGSENDYYLQLTDCETLCQDDYLSPCEISYKLMLIDMVPGGQYGEYPNPSEPLSVYYTTNVLIGNNTHWGYPQLIDEYGSHPIYVDENGDTSRIIVEEISVGVYSPAVANISNVKFDPIEEEYYVYPQELLSVDDFVANFKYSWAQSLVKYHPEYCYYENCSQWSEKVNPLDELTSYDFDKILNGIGTYAEAQENNFLPSGGPVNFDDVLEWLDESLGDTWDPFFHYSTDFSISDCFDPKSVFIDRITNFAEINGTYRNIMEIAAYYARCGNTLDVNPPSECFEFGSDFGGFQDDEVLNDEWNYLKSFYRSLKQEIQQDLLDCITLHTCQYGGCIGNEDYSPFNPSIYDNPLLGVEEGFFSYFTPSNACGSYYFLYTDKVRRFADESAVPIQSVEQGIYEIYLATGQCPIPFNLQQLLNGIVSNDEIDQTGVDLNDYGQLMNLMLAQYNYDNFAPVPNLEYNAIVTGNTITAEWINEADNSVYAILTLTLSGSVTTWADVTQIVNLYPTTGDGFEADAVYYDGTSNQSVDIIGTITTFDLSECAFPEECSLNELGHDLQNLFSALANIGEFTNPTSIDIDPLIDFPNTINGLQTNLIEAAVGEETYINWKSIAPNQFILFDNQSTTPYLTITFDEAEPASFLWPDLNTVAYFENMQSAGGHSFTIDAVLSNGDIIHLSGDIIQTNEASELTGIPVGECDLPTPVACQTQEHDAFNTMFDLLNETLAFDKYENLDAVNWFESIYLTNDVANQFPFGTQSTSSCFDETLQQLIISASNCPGENCETGTCPEGLEEFEGNCETILTGLDGTDLSSITSVTGMQLIGEPSNGSYNEFILFVQYINASGEEVLGQVSGTTCVNMKECYPCGVQEEDEQIEASNEAKLYSNPYNKTRKIEYIPLKTSMKIGNVPGTIDPCYQDYLNCVEIINNEWASLGFNGQGVIPVNQNLFSANHLCYCVDEFCDRVNQIVNGLITFDNKKRALNFLNINQICIDNPPTGGCTDAIYQEYVACVNYYNENNNFGSMTSVELLSYAEFVQADVCHCLDNYCAFLTAAANGTIPIQKTNIHWFNLEYACEIVIPTTSNCSQGEYNQYLNCVENFNENISSVYENFELIETVPFGIFNAKNYCECIDQYCDLLSATLSGEFIPSDNTMSWYQIENACEIDLTLDPCDEAYATYLNCVDEFNSWADETGFGYTVKTILGNEQFVNFCSCVDEYCDVLNDIINGNIILTITNHNYYLEIENVCGPIDCEIAYENYNNCVDAYNSFVKNHSNDTEGVYFITDEISLESFLALDLCECVDLFCENVSQIINGTIIIDSEVSFNEYLNIATLCIEDVTDIPSTTCTEEYVIYENAILEYNTWAVENNYPIIEMIVSQESFIENELCYCLTSFTGVLNEIMDGLISLDDLTENFVYYTSIENACSTVPCTPEQTTTIFQPSPTYDPVDDCVEMMQNQAYFTALNNWEIYVDSLSNALINTYNEHCLSAIEYLNYSYMDKLYHFTLYYYDQAGNLIKTIPPEGVSIVNTVNSSDALSMQINADRENHTKTVFTSHRLPTRYEYNSLNQLVAQSTPDTDPMKAFDITLSSGLPGDLVIRKIQLVNNATGYLVGERNGRGYMYQTNDGGITWNRKSGLVGTDLQKVAMVDATTGFAIGNSGIVLKTTDGGASWDMLNTWITSGTGMINDLNDILVYQESGSPSVMIVGDNGLVVNSTDLTTFNVVNTGINLTYSIASVATNGTDLYIVANGNQTATAYSMNVGGSSWTENDLFSIGELRNIDISANNEVVAAGKDGRIFKYEDVSDATGRWQMIETNTTGDITDIQFFNVNQGIAIIDGGLFRTADAGKTWVEIGTDTYTHLSESANSQMIFAVGPDDKMEIYVPSPVITSGAIDVDINVTGVNMTAGWVEQQTISPTSSQSVLVTSDDDGRIYYTFNGNVVLPIWNEYDASTEIGAATITDFKLNSVAANELEGILLTSNGDVFMININGATLTLEEKGTSYVPFSSISHDQTAGTTFVYAHSGDGKVYELDLSSGDFTNGINVGLNLNQFAVKNDNIALVGQNIQHVDLGTASATNQSLASNPVQLNAIESSTSSDMLLVGTDGTFYQQSGVNFNLIRSGSSKDFNAVKEIGTTKVIAGSEGFLSRGTTSGTNWNAVQVNATVGGTIEENINENLNDIAVSGLQVKIVGDNGTVVFSPFGLGAMALLNHGSLDLNGIAAIPSTNEFLAVGENSTVLSSQGASYTSITELFTPALKDVHFTNSSTGTILGEDFTIKRTTNAGMTWQTVTPNTAQAPTYEYRKVWTVNGTQSLVLGENTQWISTGTSAIPNTQLAGASNVYAIDNLGSFLYIVDGTTVKGYTPGTTATTLTTYIGQANAIDVLANGEFAIVGGNGLFAYHNNAALNYTQKFTAPPSDFNSEQLNDIHFIDNTYAVIVGNNMSYYKTTIPDIGTDGYLTNVDWDQIETVYNNDPYGIANPTDGNIYTVAFSSANDVVYAGEYLSTYSYSGTAQPLLRTGYDPNARYSSRFYYDKLGRLVASQNARQFGDIEDPNREIKYSYTRYDALGRVVEVGEKTENDATDIQFNGIFGSTVSGYFNPSVIDNDNLQAWIESGGARKEVTKSYYDRTIIPGVPSFDPNVLTQRKRITHVTYEEVFDGSDLTYDHATHYDYDIHGNVKTLVQDNKKMVAEFPSLAAQQYKRMDYTYDLVSGNVHRMSVQNGELDQWHHAYRYDADNRIIQAYTSKGTPLIAASILSQSLENELLVNNDWQNDATYFYYDHGPLARVELGEEELQGVDYIYNLQGWMKGINSSVLDQANDPGKDGVVGEANETFAKDVTGFSLQYFTGDYQAINGTGQNHSATVNSGSHAANNSKDLYNGNIRYMQTAITNPTTRDAMPMLNAYEYDQLNRLVTSRSYEDGLSNNEWNPTSYGNKYFNAFTYDAMGNIEKQKRHLSNGTQVEDMAYKFHRNSDGELVRNRLYHINDLIGETVNTEDIDDMGAFVEDVDLINGSNNYVYDAEGRLVQDKAELIDQITWRVDGKVKEILRPLNSGKKNVSFDYDAMGNRIAKHVFDDNWNLEKSTYYILDAQGNVLNTYDHEVTDDAVVYSLKERQIYGSSRLGLYDDTVNMFLEPTSGNQVLELGHKYYELSNHLGNVLTVIKDIKTPLPGSGTAIGGYEVAIVNVADYSPFGITLDNRTISSDSYRYGFQGQEKDDEIKGDGNSLDFGNRMYDPRVGRFLSLDAYADKFPDVTPYSFAGNMPIWATDDNGDSIRIAYQKNGKDFYYTYGSKDKVPNSRYVRKTVRTLNKIVKKGRDPIGIINFLASRAGDDAVIFKLESWYNSGAFSIQVGEMTLIDAESGEALPISEESGVGSLIGWHEKSGYISSDFQTRQSSSTALLHELGHLYYDLVDPKGERAAWDSEWAKTMLIEDETEREAAQSLLYQKKKEILGEYHTYSDRWLIQDVEPGTGEGTRKNHSDGYFLKTRGGTFSTRGNKIGKRGVEGTVKGTKANSVENGGDGTIK